MSETILISSSQLKPRLGTCEVCAVDVAKYTCPECEVKTCCLSCVKIHKKELNCSGIRNKVKFKTLNKFNNLDFQSDYILLEDATRATDNFKKFGARAKNATFYSMVCFVEGYIRWYYAIPFKFLDRKKAGGSKQMKGQEENDQIPLSPILQPRMKMKHAAGKRNIQLIYMPKNFTRHKTNTSYYNWKQDKFLWKVEWHFPDANLTLVDDRVPEGQQLITPLKKYLDPELCGSNLKKVLSDYHKARDEELVVLLKGEVGEDKKFFLLDKEDTFLENLSNKRIVEHPIFYVVRKDSLPQYNIYVKDLPKEEKYSSNFKGVNLLFGGEEVDNNCDRANEGHK